MDEVAWVWAKRAGNEYITGALTAELLHTLAIIAVSPDTLERVQRVVADEFRHAGLARQLYDAAGGTQRAFRIDRDLMSSSIAVGETDERKALARSLGNLAINETIAITIYRRMVADSTVPAVVEAAGVFLKDDAFHSAVGWDIVDELLERMPHEHAWAASLVPGFLKGLETRYGHSTRSYTPEQVGWGMFTPLTFRQVCRDSLEGDMSDQLIKRGLLDRRWTYSLDV